jgi:hypothetical protein
VAEPPRPDRKSITDYSVTGLPTEQIGRMRGRPPPKPTPASGTLAHRQLPELPALEPPKADQTPVSGQSWVTTPGASEEEVRALEQVASTRGARIVKPVPSTPPPKSVYEEASRPFRQLRWWEREDGVAKVLGAIGALSVTIGGVYATVRATAPKVEPATILVACPPLKPDATDDDRKKQPDVCRMLWDHEADINRAFRVLDSIEADRARERLLKEQAAATTITARPPK